MDNNNSKKKNVETRRIKSFVLVVILSALGVALSPISYPIGPTKAFPAQHAINVLSGILLGPILAPFVAIIIGTTRIGLGLGTVFAYPGGIFGGLFVGLAYRYFKKDYASFIEPLGTSFGAIVSALTLVPLMGKGMPPLFGITNQSILYILFWLPSTIIGTSIGYLVLKALRASKIDKKIL